MAAIQQWWLGLNRKREIVIVPGVQFLVNWFLGSGDLEATLQDGTLDNDYGTWVVDEGSYLQPESGYSTYVSTNTSTDEFVLSNTGGSKLVMEILFNTGALNPGDRPVELSCNDYQVAMIGAEGTGSAMPGQIVFSCNQTSGSGDGPNFTPVPFQDYHIVLEWNADEGPSGTARWFIDGVEWGLGSSIGIVTPLDDVVFNEARLVANKGNVYYANIYSTPGPGFNSIDWTADTDGNIGSTPAPTSIDYDNFGHSGNWQVTTPSGFGNAQSNYTYSARAGFPSEGVEFRLDNVGFSTDVTTRPGLIHHDINGDGWAFDISYSFEPGANRSMSITKWNGGSGLGVLFHHFSVGTGTRSFRAHIGNNEARMYIDDVLVAYGPHLTEEANFSASIDDIIFSGGRFDPNESTHVGSARLRDIAYPNPGSVVSADFNLAAGYEAAYTSIDADWTYWPNGVGVADQGATTRTLTSNDISFDGTGLITLTPEGDSGLMYMSGTVDLGTEDTVVMEYRVRSIAAGSKVAIGTYAPGVGPPPNFDAYLAGFSSGCAYYESNGHITGYGGVNEGDYDPYGPGDIISVVALNGSQVQFLKNGVPVGLPVGQINSTVSFMVSVGDE